jgi:hypothetical protein
LKEREKVQAILPPSPPAEKATASQDQAGQAGINVVGRWPAFGKSVILWTCWKLGRQVMSLKEIFNGIGLAAAEALEQHVGHLETHAHPA